MKEERKYAVIVTLIAVLLCVLTIFVWVKICDLINERDALKERVSDIVTTEEPTEEESSGLVEIPTDATFDTADLTFVEESTNGVGDKVKVYKDKDGNEFTANEEGRLIRTMSKPGAWSEDAAMDADALLDVAHAYMADTYGDDFTPFAYTATHRNRTTDDHQSYIIEYRNATEDQFYFICIWDNGVVLWSQFSNTTDVQTAE
jgi:hypothetical protein|uniref:Uncharacterized protein n=1 Tax=Siphoviridae sp. ctrCN24 TaxID=2827953 RepID=A0A8S5SLL9_9CAUD|nr:MAG TPA: hypothetical protein [Siphoviridae sp. ctrCN24]